MEETDIIVAGSGPAGLIAALALASDGFEVILAGPAPAQTDRRTTALMLPALALLDRLGVGEALAGAAAPLEVMRIADVTGRLVRSPTVTFRAAEIGERRFGLNMPNTHLLAVLTQAVEAESRIDWRRTIVDQWQLDPDAAVARLADGTTVLAQLAVAADGRGSPAREAAGIASRRRDLPQAALVFNVVHERPHGNVSTELHTPSGPFTQVPLPGQRSSIVWVERPETAQALAALSDADLALRAEARMESLLGKLAVDGGRQVHRLGEASASRLAARRVALVGEAAHLIPPIGAQGLNLGCADIDALASIAANNRDDPGSAAALADYDRRRRADVMARSTAVNLLNHSLLSGLLPAQIARAAGLAALGSLAPLRGFFMREGLKPGSGFRALADGLRGRGRAVAGRS
ncbi:MAG: UbiH/UbiF family hydroxylase [Rhizobiaceae bacterium]|nr:UbiH/UbiF family hydroxylase [Rhizobiaceae bacterium]